MANTCTRIKITLFMFMIIWLLVSALNLVILIKKKSLTFSMKILGKSIFSVTLILVDPSLTRL